MTSIAPIQLALPFDLEVPALDERTLLRLRRAKYAREWRAKNWEHYQLYAATYVAKNIERIKERGRQRDRSAENKNRDKVAHAASLRAWRKKNPEKYRAIDRANNLRRRAIIGTPQLSAAQWKRLQERAAGVCIYCSKQARLDSDHFIPVTKFGETHPLNIVPACRSCNSSKGNRDPHKWVVEKFGPDALERVHTFLSETAKELELDRL